jgi:hypothetical protein
LTLHGLKNLPSPGEILSISTPMMRRTLNARSKGHGRGISREGMELFRNPITNEE